MYDPISVAAANALRGNWGKTIFFELVIEPTICGASCMVVCLSVHLELRRNVERMRENRSIWLMTAVASLHVRKVEIIEIGSFAARGFLLTSVPKGVA